MDRKHFKSRYDELKTQFVNLARSGATGYQIIEKLDINAKQADAIHVDLLKTGKIDHRIKLSFAEMDDPEVAEKGNIFITAQRLSCLGLDEVFAPSMKLQIEWTGEALVIKPKPKSRGYKVPSESAKAEVAKQTERVKKGFFGRFIKTASGEEQLAHAEEN